MTTIEIIQAVSSCISWLVGGIGLICALLAKRGSRTAQAALKPLKSASDILVKLPGYISQAEQIFGAGHGQAKLGWVVQQVWVDCIRNGVTADIDVDKLTEQIEAILETPHKKEVEEHGSAAA